MTGPNDTPPLQIDRKPLDSSFLLSAGYHPESQTLHLEFKDKSGNGQVMQYEKVPAEVASAVIDAESHGKAYHEHIRPTFVGKQLTPRTQSDYPREQMRSRNAEQMKQKKGAVAAIQGRMEAWGKK